MEITEITCPHCGWHWTPRKPNPKYCPSCKRTLQQTEQQLQRKKDRELMSKTLVRYRLPDSKGYVVCKNPGCKNVAMLRFEEPGQGPTGYCIEHAIQKLQTMKQWTVEEANAICNVT